MRINHPSTLLTPTGVLGPRPLPRPAPPCARRPGSRSPQNIFPTRWKSRAFAHMFANLTTTLSWRSEGRVFDPCSSALDVRREAHSVWTPRKYAGTSEATYVSLLRIRHACPDAPLGAGLLSRPMTAPLRFYNHHRLPRSRLTLVGRQRDIDGMGSGRFPQG